MRIDWTQITAFRRKKNRLEWHFKDGCRKWPIDEYEESLPDQKVLSTMVCPICINLHNLELGHIDVRVTKEAKKSFFS